MSVIDDLIERFLEEGRAIPDSIIGCTDDEIAQVEKAQGVKLPSTYKEFLSKMGKKAGYYNVGTNIFYPELLKLKKWMTEVLEDDYTCTVAFRLPPQAFVFKSHQGYMYSYFICDGQEDPVVYYYHENEMLPEKLPYTFTQWLVAVADNDLWKLQLPKS